METYINICDDLNTAIFEPDLIGALDQSTGSAEAVLFVIVGVLVRLIIY